MLNIIYTVTWCITITIGLDPNHDQHSIGTDLGMNCLQRLLADDKLPVARTDLKLHSL